MYEYRLIVAGLLIATMLAIIQCAARCIMPKKSRR